MSLTAILWYLQDFRSEVRTGFATAQTERTALRADIETLQRDDEDLGLALSYQLKRNYKQLAAHLRRLLQRGAVKLALEQPVTEPAVYPQSLIEDGKE